MLFENEFFIAVDKPFGVLTTPSRLGAKDARPCLGTHLQAKLKIQIYPIHRLDFEVSGVVLFAKTPQAHKAANGWWESRFVVKEYEALTHDLNNGMPTRQWMNWTSKLLRGKRRAYESPIGRDSITQALFVGFVTQPPKKVARWNIRPLTGRPHQIRYELAKHGFPILGDIMYGASDIRGIKDRIALRSTGISFKGLSDRVTWKLPEEIKAPAIQLKDYIPAPLEQF